MGPLYTTFLLIPESQKDNSPLPYINVLLTLRSSRSSCVARLCSIMFIVRCHAGKYQLCELIINYIPMSKKKTRIFLFVGKVKDLRAAIAKELDAHYGIIDLKN